MSGYREHSFDPNAYEQPGQPLKPYNWVQWTGVAFEVIGVGLFLAYVAGKIGWIDPVIGSGTGFVPMMIGIMLVNSRREPSSLVTPEQQARNKRTLIIMVVAAAVLGTATIIEFQGA